MASYAEGRKAFGFCDRCGFRYNLKDLKTETVNLATTNLLVCPECWDPDHPQNMLGRMRVDDPEALRNPRPLGGISGRDLPAAYRWDFSTGTAQTSPTRIDGWRVANGTLSWNSDSQSLNLVYSGTSGDPYIVRGYNGTPYLNDWISIDSSKYKYVVCDFTVNSFPDFEPDDFFEYDFQGKLFWTNNTNEGGGSNPWPFDSDRTQEVQAVPYFLMSQPADGFSAANKNLTSHFKIVYDLSDNNYWTGTVTGIRLDFFNTTPDGDAGDINIHYIEVVSFHNPDL